MILPYKMDRWYFIANIEDKREELVHKLDGTRKWQYLNILEWFKNHWDPGEIDYKWFIEAANEVSWLEILIVTNQSRLQTVEEYEYVFTVPEQLFTSL